MQSNGSVVAVLLSTLTLCGSLHAAGQQDDLFRQQQRALDEVIAATGRICTTVPLEENNKRITLTGDAKAELNGLVKKIAELGIHGAATYETNEGRGVLQAQLADAIKSGDNCRLSVLKELKAMIPGLEPGSMPPNDQPTPQLAPRSTNNAIKGLDIKLSGELQFRYAAVRASISYSGDHGSNVILIVCAQQNGQDLCGRSRYSVAQAQDAATDVIVPLRTPGFMGRPFDEQKPIDFEACFVVPREPAKEPVRFGCQAFTHEP
jgi:hypothetical protein